MKITLASAFRNSTPYLNRYLAQVDALQEKLNDQGDSLTCLFGEGDSIDDTLAELRQLTCEYDTIIDCTHGGAEYGSIVSYERFKQLAYVANKIWSAIPTDADAFLWVESDLIWDANTMLMLLDRLNNYPAVAPMVFLHRHGWAQGTWYDTYAFRRDGVNFGHNRPYHEKWKPGAMMRVDSAGSCMALRGDIARRIVWDEAVFPGACKQIYKMGGSVWLDSSLAVTHA